MGAAAQLGRVGSGLEHPHDVAVLVAEEGDGPELLGEVLGGLVVAHREVAQDVVVGQVLDLGDLVRSQRLVVADGFIEKKKNPKKSLKKDMCLKDGSAPKTPADYKISNPANNSYSSISPTAIL